MLVWPIDRRRDFCGSSLLSRADQRGVWQLRLNYHSPGASYVTMLPEPPLPPGIQLPIISITIVVYLSLSPPLLSLVPPHYLAHVTMKTTSVRWLVKPGTRRTRAGSRQGKMIITKIYEVRGCSITIHTPQMSSILRTLMHNACAFFTNCIILGTGEGYSKIIFSFIIFFFTTRPSPLQGRWTYWLK